jgi:RHS repeat-associated protein
VNTTNFDALGRVQSTKDGLGQSVQRAYRYGTGGTSYELVSNPYASTGDATMGWTLTTRTLGTPYNVTATSVAGYQGATLPGVWGGGSPNSNATGTVSTTANVLVPGSVPGCGGVATTTTDAAGHIRTNCMDGLGRLAAVIEPNGMLTNYTYDLLDNLTGVSAQCLAGAGYTCSPVGSTGQTRTFTYTTLSRLQNATNPESGSVSYTYYPGGNLKTRTDANLTQATFTYDGLNRPTGITYSPASPAAATPNVQYSYDNNSVGAGFTGFVGALSSVSSSASKMEYSYDGFGRVVASRQTTPNNQNGTPYAFANYQYSLTDQLTGITYPSGRAIAYTLDADDQATSVKSTPAGGSATTYASGITYNAAGGLSSLPFQNGITESHTWNSLFEHTGISAGNLLALNYNYCNNGAQVCSSGNTGSPWQQTIAVGGQTMAVQEYVHDPMNRLVTLSERAGGTSFSPTCPDSASVWCRQLSYDNSGNVTVTNRSPAGANSWDVASFNAKNQAPGWGYDLAGNVTAAPGATIGYDAENRQVAFGSTQYVYDGLGNRVQKIDQYNNATTYVYDAFGNLAAEYGGSPSAPGTTQYVTMDALGSTRLVMSGAQASERHDFQPFGLETFADSGTWRTGVAGYGVDTVRQKFTGQERDGESYLDFFQARYFSPIQGRFTSPDPGNAGADPSDPQSWNGYAYVSNNPLTFTDPSGQFGEATGVGAAACGPLCAGIGAAVDIGIALLGILGGGGSHTDLSSVAWTPDPQSSIGGLSGGPLSGGGVFGSGNTGPFVFSATPSTTWPGTWPGALPGATGTSWWDTVLGAAGQAAQLLTMPVRVGMVMVINPKAAGNSNEWASIGLCQYGQTCPGLTYAKGEGGRKTPSKLGAKPKEVPTGTKPIDEMGWGSGRIHGIKDGLGAGPRDWVGIAPNGDVITGDAAGNAVNNGPWTSYIR